MVGSTWTSLLPQLSFLITGTPASRLITSANNRIRLALRPHTSKMYDAKFNAFMAFAVWNQLRWEDIDTILAFLEFLVQSGSKAHTLSSYISVLKHYFNLYNISVTALSHRKVHLFIKSVAMNSVHTPKYKATMSIHVLTQLVNLCGDLLFGKAYKACFLLAFFVFLRLSNIASVSASSFDPTRHFMRGDIIFGPPGAHVIVKWGKAMQAANKHHVVQIPLIPGSPICPVTALKQLLSSPLLPSSSPLFLVHRSSGSSILTSPMISSTLSKLLSKLGLNPASYGFHCFRRSGVSWAAANNVPLQNLQAHGG